MPSGFALKELLFGYELSSWSGVSIRPASSDVLRQCCVNQRTRSVLIGITKKMCLQIETIYKLYEMSDHIFAFGSKFYAPHLFIVQPDIT